MYKPIPENSQRLKRVRGVRMKLASVWRWAAAQALLLTLVVFAPSVAKADFRVCNATQSLVGVAIGYRATDGWKTEGWWQIDASTCKTLIEGSLSSRYYYLYAEDAERGGRWDGPVNMCIAKEPFKIVGVNDCFSRGFERAGFQEYDTGEQSSWMVQLTDEPAAGEPETPPAPQAGADTETAPQEGTETTAPEGEGDAPPDAGSEGSGDQ